MHGEGTFAAANGEQYNGKWKKSLADGEGKYVLIDGTKYLGKYKQGERHGAGIITWKTGDVLNGKWKRGILNGRGDFQFSNGDQYNASWDNGELEGESTYVCANGKEIKGNLTAIERTLKRDKANWEVAKVNIGLSWYAIALECKTNKEFKRAKKLMEKAQKYSPASSDLNKLIHLQLKIIEEKINNQQS